METETYKLECATCRRTIEIPATRPIESEYRICPNCGTISDHLWAECNAPRAVVRWVALTRCLFPVAYFLLFSGTISNATTIVAIWTPSDVTIAADAKYLTGDGRALDPICKIRMTNGVLYAHSGLAANVKTGFSVDDLLNATLKTDGTLAERVERIDAQIVPRLRENLASIKSEDPEFTKRWIDAAPLEIIFVAVENHQPELLIDAYKANVGADGAVMVTPTQKACPGVCDPRGTFGAFIGVHDLIDREAAADPNTVVRLGVEGAVRHFVEEEIADRPDMVSGPLSIVRISDAGATWVEVGLCGANQPSTRR
jgi:hypothetical protein